MYLSRVKDIVPLKRFCEGKFTQKFVYRVLKICKIRFNLFIQILPVLKNVFCLAFKIINVLEIFVMNVTNNEIYKNKFL